MPVGACIRRRVAVTALGATVLAVSACRGGFDVANYLTPISAYQAGVEQFERGKWTNAIAAFEKATLSLPMRDTLLVRAHFYLGRAHERKKEFLLAGASFKRIVDDFPDDTLADDALLAMSAAYYREWRGPEWDPVNALQALEGYNVLPRVYANSPFIDSARTGESAITEGLARKDFENGMYYVRRRAWDSALIYFKDAATDYPMTRTALEARLMMVDIYLRLNYRDDARDVCRALRTEHAEDVAVRRACASIPADTTG